MLKEINPMRVNRIIKDENSGTVGVGTCGTFGSGLVVEV
jgi:hypothetical protein